MRKQTRVLYESHQRKVWQDVNGTMWRHDKESGALFKMIQGEWELIDSIFVDALLNPDNEFV